MCTGCHCGGSNEPSVAGVSRRGRPPMTWKGRADQFIREKIGGRVRALDRAKEASTDRFLVE